LIHDSPTMKLNVITTEAQP